MRKKKGKQTYANVEFARVDGIVMSVESLNTLARADIPHRHSLVTTAAGEHLRIWLELN